MTYTGHTKSCHLRPQLTHQLHRLPLRLKQDTEVQWSWACFKWRVCHWCESLIFISCWVVRTNLTGVFIASRCLVFAPFLTSYVVQCLCWPWESPTNWPETFYWRNCWSKELEVRCRGVQSWSWSVLTQRKSFPPERSCSNPWHFYISLNCCN